MYIVKGMNGNVSIMYFFLHTQLGVHISQFVCFLCSSHPSVKAKIPQKVKKLWS